MLRKLEGASSNHLLVHHNLYKLKTVGESVAGTRGVEMESIGGGRVIDGPSDVVKSRIDDETQFC